MADQNPISTAEISALILAGGRGSRLGGTDKGLMSIAGRPAIEHVLERIAIQAPAIMISANRNLERYAGYGYAVIEDAIDGFAGPLAGIASGLAACQTDYLLTLPVDAPFVSPRYAERMRTGLEQGAERACVAECRGQLEPVFCLLHRHHYASLMGYLQQGQRSVRQWLADIGAARVDFSDVPEQFINLNAVQDQQSVEQRLRR